ncbi:hypothetical protein swp_1761 [Shewanella piezotolerans WP3]|uniref:Uncharacterized protein n=1 Tax=Shewanella piezotolerans (strain WP3 / JCM 13877) TaxID=225849 RepID=B8CN27_SHEPW|nr:hypothetical protein swp_1761 [Shewanella piezotolerans WP3]
MLRSSLDEKPVSDADRLALLFGAPIESLYQLYFVCINRGHSAWCRSLNHRFIGNEWF